MTRDRVRIGVVGLGSLGRYHAETIAWRCGRADLWGVVDQDARMAETVGVSLDVAWDTTYEAMMESPDVDAVIVATPTATHLDVIERAAQGRKHVFCEKPIELDIARTTQALEAIAVADVYLQVGFQRRFDRAWNRAKTELTSQDGLGKPYLFRISHRNKYASPESARSIALKGTLIVDGGIHDFETARWLLGEIDELAVFGGSLSTPTFGDVGDADNMLIVVRFVNGALGCIDLSRVAGYGVEASMEIVGSHATVRIPNLGYDIEHLTDGVTQLAQPADNIERYAEAYTAELQQFVHDIIGDTAPQPDGEDGLAAFSLALAAEHAYQTRRPVRLHRAKSSHGLCYEVDDA